MPIRGGGGAPEEDREAVTGFHADAIDDGAQNGSCGLVVHSCQLAGGSIGRGGEDDVRGRGGGYAEALRDLSVIRVAVNQEYVGPDHPIREGDEVAGFRVIHFPGHAPGLIGLWRESDRVAIVTLNRPESRNALNPALTAALPEAILVPALSTAAAAAALADYALEFAAADSRRTPPAAGSAPSSLRAGPSRRSDSRRPAPRRRRP